MKRLAFYILLFVFICMGASYAQAEDLQTLDQPALDKMLKDSHGKVVLLNVFATWCPPCKVEIPDLVDVRNDYSTDQLVLIGLSVDEDGELVEPFMEETGINYPVYLASKSITNKFGINSVPHNIFFGKDGKMFFSEPGMIESNVLKKIIDELLAK